MVTFFPVRRPSSATLQRTVVLPLLALVWCLALGVGNAVVQGQSCNCQGVGGSCGLNCSSASSCCGYGSMDPSCLTPGNQCCIWYLASVQCSAEESCCGELGYGASSSAFCCGAGSSCCATTGDGISSCCGAGQQCCKGYDSYCCDAETEVCGKDDSMICLPKHPITRNPHAKPGELEWAANFSASWDIHVPVRVNDSFVVASGSIGTALVRLSDGAITVILPESFEVPAVVSGRIVVSTYDQLVSYDLKHGNRSWTAAFVTDGIGLVSHGDYLLAPNNSGLNVFDARNGSLKYTVPFPYGPAKPVVSSFGTVAFAYGGAFVIFQLDTGKILVNASTTCYNPPPPLLTSSMFISCSLVAYSARSGKQLWAAATSQQAGSMAGTTKTVVAAPQSGSVPFGVQELYIVAKGSGSILTTVPLPLAYPWEYVALTAVSGSEVLASYGNITAFNGTTGAVLWNYTNPQYSFDYTTSGVEHGGYVYLQASTETYPAAMVAVHAATGAIAGSWGAGGSISRPLFVGGRLLFTSADGFLYCVNAL